MIAAWFVINILQSVFTSMSYDESYYALWGKKLAWGYFDHPPMVALFNLLSSFLFKGNLGVRFITVLAQVATICLIWKIIDDKKPETRNVFLFFIIAASMPMFEVLGFITTPDAPLLLFTALFLFAYKEFLDNDGIINSILLSLSMAGMVYSKYQAVIVILFTVFSNLKLLKNPRFWLAGILALLLLAPHFYWQYSNGFPSFKYHLAYRSDRFKLGYFLEYIPNQLIIFNPFTFGLLIYIMIKSRIRNDFDRSLYFIAAGFIIFFWIMTFRGHVEPHWTVAASVPIIIILYGKAKENSKIRRFVNRYLLGFSLMLVCARIVIVCFPSVAAKADFHGSEKYMYIERLAGNSNVVFPGSFQQPSIYTYYTGRPATAINSVSSRRTQFDVWQMDKEFEGKPAFVCAKVKGLSKEYHIDGKSFYGFHTDAFHTSLRLSIKTVSIGNKAIYPGDTILTKFSLHNPYDFSVDFNDKTFPVSVCACFLMKKTKKVSTAVCYPRITTIKPGETISGTLYVIVPKDIRSGGYNFCFTTRSIFGPSLENEMSTINVARY